MKSFFKKLAFVMALAMVVSLAAPAAAKADTVVSLADQYTGTVYEEVDLTLEEVIDFKFVNPPEGWDASGVQRAWVSSNPEVATVNGWGKVFPVALGTTEISWTIDGTAVATCTVNVIEEVEVEEPVATPTNTAAPTPTNTTAPSPTPTEAPLSFDVVQVSDSKLEVRFNKASTYAEKDVNFLITFDNPYGEKPIEFKWNLKNKTYNADKTVLTLTANGLFKNGATYAIETADKKLRDDVEIVIGKVTAVALVPRKDATTGEEIVFVNPKIDEDTAIDYDLYFDVKLYSGEGDSAIEVTDTYWDYIDVDFLVEGLQVPADVEEVEDVVIIDLENIATKREIKVNFEAENTVVNIVPNFIIDTGLEDEEAYTVGGPKTLAGAGAHREWSIYGVVEWTIVPATQDAKKPVDWTKHSLTADETDNAEYYIVLKLIDSNEQTYVTYEKAVEDGAHKYIGAVDYFDERFLLEFMPSETSENDILVEEDGEVKVYKETTATFVVEMTDLDAEEQDPEIIWADDIKVEKGKELDKVDIKAATMTVLTETNIGSNETKLEIVAESQYAGKALPLNADDFTYTVASITSDVTLPANSVKVVPNGTKMEVVAYGDLLKTLAVTEVDVKVTVTEKATGNKAEDVVKINIVKTKDANEEFMYAQSTKKTGYKYVDVALVEAAAVEVKGSTVPEGGVFTGTASVYYAAKGTTTKVDAYDLETANDGNGAIIATDTDIEKTITGEGTVYVIVKDPSGNLVTEGVTLDGNNVIIELTHTEGGELKINAEGKYTVQVGVVRYYKENPDRRRGDYLSAKAELKVENKLDKVSFVETKNDATYDYSGEVADFEADVDAVKALIKHTLKFKKGSTNDWDFDVEDIYSYKIVCLGNKVIVKAVTFHVPAENDTYYVQECRPIDKAITLE